MNPEGEHKVGWSSAVERGWAGLAAAPRAPSPCAARRGGGPGVSTEGVKVSLEEEGFGQSVLRFVSFFSPHPTLFLIGSRLIFPMSSLVSM